MGKRISAVILGFLFFIFTFNCFAVSKPIVLGDDQIITQPYLKLLKGKRVAIVANMASVNSKGQHIIDVLWQNPKIHLVAIFTPEHGLREALDQPIINDSIDKKTGLPVYSLYGKTHSPSKAQMKKVDIILFDLQSVGVRYYTFISTLALVMQAAKKYNKEVIVLDRPNPLGGKIVYGPVLTKNLAKNFTAYYPIPMRYGLTIGELARYYNKYFHINAKLRVIPLKNWHRNMLFPATGLKWVPPSPALRTFKQVFLYSVLGPLESLTLVVGRDYGNHEQFFDRVYGATWMSRKQAAQLVAKLQALKLSGLKFSALSWKKKKGMDAGKVVNGFRLYLTSYKNVHSYASLLAILKVLYQMFGDALLLNTNNEMIGSAWIVNAIKTGMPIKKMIAYDNQVNKPFMRNSKSIYLYK